MLFKKKLVTKTSIWKKTGLVFMGLVLSFFLLEIGMRLGGFILLSIQDHRNVRLMQEGGTYRILCLGESTTYRQYPGYLEKILNQRNIGIHFRVIDQGRPATTTAIILNELKSHLDEYHPQMVVAMMGINDGRVEYLPGIPGSSSWFFRHCRVYRFGRLLWEHFLNKPEQRSFPVVQDGARASRSHFKDEENERLQTPLSHQSFPGDAAKMPSGDPLPDPRIIASAGNAGSITPGKTRSALPEASLEKMVPAKDQDDQEHLKSGVICLNEGRFSAAEAHFKEALRINPKNDEIYVQLGWFYRVKLGARYRTSDAFPEAENAFLKAIELNPRNSGAYSALGWLSLDQGKFSQAEELFKKGIMYDPGNGPLYSNLGILYRTEKRFDEAESYLKKAIELDPNNQRMRRAIASLYRELKKPELAEKYMQSIDPSLPAPEGTITANNYHQLKRVLDLKKIPLVCVQYPMRNAAPLRRIFKDDPYVFFVDNERSFMEAVEREGYQAYFRDMFAGDFGHCTPKGNQLLAANIADVILKEVIGKS